jgi:uncharacterized protein (TIGR01777 family)
MQVAITGSTGLIGSALTRSLREDGHRVLRLVRGDATADDEVSWDIHGTVDTEPLEGIDAVVHLAGAGVGDHRWTESYKRTLRDSRIAGTETLTRALAGLEAKPKVLVSGSAIGYCGDTGDTETDESGPQGEGFLAQLVHDWEAAADPAREAGIRVVHSRTGLVLTPDGGLLGQVLPLYKLGLGGRLGDGRQWFSWISEPDHIAGLRFLIDGDLEGPVNLTAPKPVTNAVYTKAVGAALNRPTMLAVPSFALRIALGQFADEGALVSQRAVPRRLTEAGFTFGHPDVNTALNALLRHEETTNS